MNHHGQSRDLDKTFNTPVRKGLRCAWEYGYYKASRRRLQNSLQVGECLIRMIPIQEGSPPPPRRTGRDLRSPRQTSRAERWSCERRTCQIVSSIFGVSLGIVWSCTHNALWNPNYAWNVRLGHATWRRGDWMRRRPRLVKVSNTKEEMANPYKY